MIAKKRLIQFYFYIWSINKQIGKEPRHLKNVFVSPATGLIFSKYFKIYSETAYSKFKVFSLLSSLFEKISFKRINRTVAIIEHGIWRNHYHWFIDILPRIWHLVLQKDCNNQVLLLVTQIRTEEEYVLLSKLIPSNVSVEMVSSDSLIFCKSAIGLPFLSNSCSGKLPKDYLDHFLNVSKSTFNLHFNSNLPKKIFISRSKAEVRKFINSQEVESHARLCGYEVILLEDYLISEQAQLFYNAEIVIAQHGAGLTNLLFCNYNTKVLEIFHFKNLHLNHYKDLASSKGLEYFPYYLNGKSKNENMLLTSDDINDIFTFYSLQENCF